MPQTINSVSTIPYIIHLVWRVRIIIAKPKVREDAYRTERNQENHTSVSVVNATGVHDQFSSTKTLPAKITNRVTTHVEKKTITKACSQLAVA